LAKLLLTHAFEVEGIEKFHHGLDGVVVGQVVKLGKHPNADKLRVAEVAVGKKDIRQIVCGAPNIALGQKVAVALPGAKLPARNASHSDAGGPGGIEIKAAALRGVESRGMICSARELGLGDEHAGILVLPEDTPIGASFAKHFELEDSIIEVKILPDRGSDALAYQGIAREIAALDGYAPHFGEKRSEKKSKPIKIPSYNRAPKISISDKQGCRRYIGVSFKDVTVGTSPLWLQVKLSISGLRPVNNIVDITNYLMLLTGQPMHAYDADKVSGALSIRRAKKNEKLTLLAGEMKKLTTEDLVIADDQKILALAGVMGGKDTAIAEGTSNVLLEIANFDGPTVRRTKTRHNLPTDASYRFERGLDPNLPEEAAREAALLVASLASGKCTGMRDIYPSAAKPWKIRLLLDRVRSVLGVKIPLFEAVRFLALLGLTVKKVADQEILEVTVPTRRPDLRDEWNLIEEIGRMYGYEKIAPVAPLVPLASIAKNAEKAFEREAKEYLAGSGFDELMTYSFYGERDQSAARLPRTEHLELENPMNPQQKLLRMTLAPTMLRKVCENLRHFDHFDCFEWESVFVKGGKKQMTKEKKSLILATVIPKKSGRGETAPKAGVAFFTLKGKVAAFLDALHIGNITFEPLPESSDMPEATVLHPTRSALVRSGKTTLGVIGELHPAAAEDFDLDARVALAEFDVAALAAARNDEIIFAPLQKFPFAIRDISLTFPKRVTVAEAEALLYEAGAPLLKASELFDVYEKDDEKSLAFHLFFGATDRTLSSEEMDNAFDRIVALAKERFEARLRI
jgi:phenylalanyl-tRNA synthetase beta chain